MNLSELKGYIHDRLVALSGLTVYDGKADEDDETFPYICFSFPSSSFEKRNRDDRVLEIDYWNNTNDDTEILEASEKVRNGNNAIYGLDKSYQTEDEGFYRANIEFEGQIPVQDRNMCRIQQRYLLHVRSSADVIIIVPVISEDININTPTINTGVNINAPVISENLSINIPEISADDNIHAPVISETININAPEVSVNANVSVPAIEENLNINAPTIAAGANVNVPAISENLNINAPDISAGANIDIPAISENVDIVAPSVSAGVNISVPVIAETLSIHAPEVDGGSSGFTFSVETTNTGVSSSTQFKVPTISTGTYDCHVDWGDSSSDDITTWDDSAWTHTYSSGGEYEITITGTFRGFRFAGGGDKLKILDISNWGDMRLGTTENGYFNGCTNLTISATDELDSTGLVNLQQAFANCQNLVTIPQFSDLSSVTSYRQMFYYCTSLNTSISNLHGASNVTTMYGMFYGASSFNQAISGLDVSNVSTMEYMLDNSAISNANYSNALIVWEGSGNHQDSVTIDTDASYTAGAATARSNLISTHSWTINDGGAE